VRGEDGRRGDATAVILSVGYAIVRVVLQLVMVAVAGERANEIEILTKQASGI